MWWIKIILSGLIILTAKVSGLISLLNLFKVVTLIFNMSDTLSSNIFLSKFTSLK